MNLSYRSTPCNVLEKFDSILCKLAASEINQDLDEAIISWCIELSLEKYFPQISKEIVDHKNLWLQQNIVIETALEIYRKLLVETDKKIGLRIGNLFDRLAKFSRQDFYHNIQEIKKNMTIKSIILFGFVLTGVGLLLYLVNKKSSNSNLQSKSQAVNYSNYIPPIREKYILALLIKSDRYQDLIHSLKNNNYLQPEDSSKLYGATQGLIT